MVSQSVYNNNNKTNKIIKSLFKIIKLLFSHSFGTIYPKILFFHISCLREISRDVCGNQQMKTVYLHAETGLS